MTEIDPGLSPILQVVAAHLDIPRSYYEKAVARHRSLGEWMQREGSLVAAYSPHMHPQGSFRYGTVIPPLNKNDEYDLDNVCVLRVLSTSAMTQEHLKRIYGEELRAYAQRHQMSVPPEEHNRCWRLRYADEVSFHLDSLPCVPDDGSTVRQLVALGVAESFAQRAVAITDRRHPYYRKVSNGWARSNPRGFARWFESRASIGRAIWLREQRINASVEDVPSYEWKTTLQRGIQLLKRHRDVMFRNSRALAPISMIITNLAAHAYSGESDLAVALTNILARIPSFVRETSPRVPNPTYPLEDYADKWSVNRQLEDNFWLWHHAVVRDISHLAGAATRQTATKDVKALFQIELTNEDVERLERFAHRGAKFTPTVAAPMIVSSAPKPWGSIG